MALTIRAQFKADLVELRDGDLPGLGAIERGGGADYTWRATAAVDEFAEACASMARIAGIHQLVDAGASSS
jgi:hypothetical protein